MIKKNFFCISIIFISFILISCTSITPIERIEQIYDIDLPKSEILFHYKDKTFIGKADIYTIIKFEEEPIQLLNSNIILFEEQKNSWQEEELVERLLNWANAPNDILPNWNEKHKSFTDDLRGNYLVYFPDTLILYFCVWGY